MACHFCALLPHNMEASQSQSQSQMVCDQGNKAEGCSDYLSERWLRVCPMPGNVFSMLQFVPVASGTAVVVVSEKSRICKSVTIIIYRFRLWINECTYAPGFDFLRLFSIALAPPAYNSPQIHSTLLFKCYFTTFTSFADIALICCLRSCAT